MIPKAFKLVSRGKNRSCTGVHENCAAYSPEVFQDEEGDGAMCWKRLSGRGARRCAACKKSGATIGCIFGKCKDSYHLDAHATGWTFASGTSTFSICPKHRLDYNAPGGRDTWCLCKTPEDTGGFWMCCDTCENWFHPKCVSMPQNLAKSLLVYQCPFCRESEGGYPLGAADRGLRDGLPGMRATCKGLTMVTKKLKESLSQHCKQRKHCNYIVKCEEGTRVLFQEASILAACV